MDVRPPPGKEFKVDIGEAEARFYTANGFLAVPRMTTT